MKNGGESMKVKDILREKGSAVYSLRSDETIFEAIRKMSELNIGALLIIDDDKVKGILSERDYRDKVILKGRSSKSTPVSEIMTRQVFCVSPNDSIHLCMKLMTEKRFRHLPVMKDDQLVGIISIGDVVKMVIDKQKVEIKSLRNYIAGGYPA